MEKILTCLLLLASGPGLLAQEDMEGKAFLFPKESSSSYVRLMPEKNGPFDALTVCLRSYTELTRSYSLFSLNTPSRDNDFLLFPYPHPTNKLSVSVASKDLFFNLTKENILEWKSICVSWESSTGMVVVWINGMPYPRRLFQAGQKISTNPIIIIGQEQDSYGGSFDASQSFVGEISDVNMWDKVLSFRDIYDVLNNKGVTGNVINWRSLQYDIKGEVIVLPYLCPIQYNRPCCDGPM
ncbi:C-reactive protein-like isoform 2-T3 [Discoglossus pictus]